MKVILFAAALAVISGLGCYVATGAVTGWLRRRSLLDHPNERSSHVVPTPRGGGLGVLAALLPAWIICGFAYPDRLTPSLIAMMVSLIALSAISFLDDLRSLPAWLRLLAQIAAVTIALSLLPADALVVDGYLPPLLDRLITGLAWVWFLNLFNFMDGIDGISGVEASSIGLGAALVGGLSAAVFLIAPGLSLAACAIAFLAWNWHPAKVFLGDAGSVPLGFALFWLLLMLWLAGDRQAAVILPAYYLADATITLIRRALRGEKIWQAHRSHFYQRAAQNGASHDWIARRILAANIVLIVLALVAPSLPAFTGVILAAIVTAALLIRLATIRVTV
jgi:UDP-N-acetylmuramyl pentapeptide phosphotransferase/UDP-N-acetylglucosamine-1-phosphate transferase